MQNSVVMFIFFAFDLKYSFWANLASKLKFFYGEIWYLDYFEYVEFNDDAQFFFFRPEILFWGNFAQKIRVANLS